MRRPMPMMISGFCIVEPFQIHEARSAAPAVCDIHCNFPRRQRLTG
jgi:hypothetical protein